MKYIKILNILLTAFCSISIALNAQIASRALINAIQTNDYEAVSSAIDAGSGLELYWPKHKRTTAILFAIAKKADPAIIQRVLDTTIARGLNRLLDRREEYYGFTALHMATFHNNSDAVRLLLNYPVNPEQPDLSGDTPLEFARKHGKLKIAKLIENAIESRKQAPIYANLTQELQQQLHGLTSLQRTKN